MDPATAWGSWKESCSEGGWQCLPGSIPSTTCQTKPTYCTKQGHGRRWFWDRSTSKERQRNWERVWSRSLMMSNWGSCGYLAWRKGGSRDLISLYNSLKGVCSKTRANLSPQVTGQEEMGWGCAKRDLDWIQNIFTERGSSSTRTGFPGKWWSHHSWTYLKMCGCGM